jgi:hypothetical protein
MKKTFTILTLVSLLALAGCVPTGNIVPAGNSTSNQPPQDEAGPDMATICSGLCGRTIQDLCRDEIEDMKASGQSLDDSIMDEITCQFMCEAEWTDDTIECVSAADDCGQLLNASPYCMETEVKDGDAEAANQPLPGNCDRACRNYAKCTSYGDDITAADQEDAYHSCLQVCATWTDTQRNCMTNTKIDAPIDCAAQTACVLPAVDAMMR